MAHSAGLFPHELVLCLLLSCRGIQVPLVPGGAAAGGPAGMLEVKLVRLSGLRSEDLLGQSDPFVIFRVGQTVPGLQVEVPRIGPE